jgi:L-lactate dehydrogenase complex protein LldG
MVGSSVASMTSEVIDDFESSLARVDVALTRTTTGALADQVTDLVESPAVGVDLPFEGASLPADVVTDPTTAELEAATTGVTGAEFAVAEYGSVVVRPTASGEEPVSLFVDRHVAVVAESDVIPDMAAGIERLAEVAAGDGPGDAIVATGPSATADMGELVKGAHGPKAVDVVLLEDR